MVQYQESILYLAVGLADHYLAKLSQSDEKVVAPCLVTLSVTCLLLAVKVEEHIPKHSQPDINTMIKLLQR